MQHRFAEAIGHFLSHTVAKIGVLLLLAGLIPGAMEIYDRATCTWAEAEVVRVNGSRVRIELTADGGRVRAWTSLGKLDLKPDVAPGTKLQVLYRARGTKRNPHYVAVPYSTTTLGFSLAISALGGLMLLGRHLAHRDPKRKPKSNVLASTTLTSPAAQAVRKPLPRPKVAERVGRTYFTIS